MAFFMEICIMEKKEDTSKMVYDKERKSKKYKRRKRRQRILILKSIVLIVLLVLLGVGIYMLNKDSGRGNEENKGKFELEQNEKNEEKTTPTPEPTPTLEPVKQISSEGLHSSHATLIRLEDEAVMMDKAGNEKTYPASVTKIMTAVVAIENLQDLNEQITLSSDMFQRLYQEGASMAGFNPGEVVPVKDLLYGVMLPSGAEACIGLAERIAGSEEAFVEMMNQKAQELGMTGTHFVTSTGLHDENHYTTTADMAHLLAYALKNETFREIFTAESYTTQVTPSHPEGITFRSTMFKKMESSNLENGGKIEGGKTGYTSAAQLCLASVAVIDGKEYVLVTTNAAGNHETEQFNITDAFTVYNRI